MAVVSPRERRSGPLRGLAGGAPCFLCELQVDRGQAVVYWQAASLLVLHGHCAEYLGRGLIGDAREAALLNRCKPAQSQRVFEELALQQGLAPHRN